MARRILLLWSGGIESTSLLKWLLEETDWQVRAHHVSLHNREGRANLEGDSVRKLLARLNIIRPFGVSYSSLQICSSKATPPDYRVLYPVGHAAAEYMRCTHMTRGWCAEDDWARVGNSTEAPTFRTPSVRGRDGRWSQQLRVLSALIGDAQPEDAHVHDYCLWLPPHEWTKAQHVAYLGKWAALTHSCRSPVHGAHACGVCLSCVARSAAEKGTSAIPELCRDE